MPAAAKLRFDPHRRVGDVSLVGLVDEIEDEGRIVVGEAQREPEILATGKLRPAGQGAEDVQAVRHQPSADHEARFDRREFVDVAGARASHITRLTVPLIVP